VRRDADGGIAGGVVVHDAVFDFGRRVIMDDDTAVVGT
jgi:hypothetical protein